MHIRRDPLVRTIWTGRAHCCFFAGWAGFHRYSFRVPCVAVPRADQVNFAIATMKPDWKLVKIVAAASLVLLARTAAQRKEGPLFFVLCLEADLQILVCLDSQKATISRPSCQVYQCIASMRDA